MGERPLVIDNDLGYAWLEEGTNRILLKLMHQGGPWRFTVRGADTTGRQRLTQTGEGAFSLGR